MHKFKYKGQDFSNEEVLTQPNQAMSLQEILERFVRHEPLAIGKDVNFHESEDDLEKLIHLDPVDRAAYIKRMQRVQDEFNVQQEKLRLQMEEDARKQFLEKLAKENQPESPKRPSKAAKAK